MERLAMGEGMDAVGAIGESNDSISGIGLHRTSFQHSAAVAKLKEQVKR
jgi:hypothetical protein